MEVKMNKEIRDYQESMFFGLDFRQCFFSVLAILTAVGIYFSVHTLLGEEVTGWLCVLGAVPFAACGFFKYHGMNRADVFQVSHRHVSSSGYGTAPRCRKIQNRAHQI